MIAALKLGDGSHATNRDVVRVEVSVNDETSVKHKAGVVYRCNNG